MMKNDLCERLFEFAVKVIEYLPTLPYNPENKIIRTQLLKSASSTGANSADLDYLIKKSAELKNILGSIVQKSR